MVIFFRGALNCPCNRTGCPSHRTGYGLSAGSVRSVSSVYLVYSKTTGVLSYDADGSGAKAAVEFAALKKGLKLSYHDVFVM